MSDHMFKTKLVNYEIYLVNYGILVQKSNSKVAPIVIPWESAVNHRNVYKENNSVLKNFNMQVFRANVSNTQTDNIQLITMVMGNNYFPIFEKFCNLDVAYSNLISYMIDKSIDQVNPNPHSTFQSDAESFVDSVIDKQNNITKSKDNEPKVH